MKNNFDQAATFNSAEEPEIVTLIRDWGDEDLPPEVKAFSLKAVFTSHTKPGGNALDFVPEGKLKSVKAAWGDEIEVLRMVGDSTYHGDGIIKIRNVTNGMSATIKDWEASRESRQEE